MCLAIPGKLTETQGEGMDRSGKVSFGGAVREVNLAFVPEASQGDYVLVHVGLAIARIDEDEAQQVFEYLDQMEYGETGGLE